jgi:hypothetical protein
MVIYFLKNLVKIKEISLGVAASYNEARKAIVCGFSLSHTHRSNVLFNFDGTAFDVVSCMCRCVVP